MATSANGLRPTPRLGLLITSIDVFDPEAKDRSEASIRRYFDELAASGKVDAGSLVIGRIERPHEAVAAAAEFARACVDVVAIANVAFPNGQVFLALATDPYLSRIPLAVIADPEPEGDEWATNAWCGAIMNNFAAHRLGRAIAAIPGPSDGQAFREEFERLLRVAAAIKALRQEFIGRYGDAPGGFHSATGDQLAYAAKFGTRVDTVDLSAVRECFETGKTSGYLGETSFTDDEVKATMRAVREGREVSVDDEMLEKGCRMYHALRCMAGANGHTSLALRCWPEVYEPHIGVSLCLSISLLLGNGDVRAAACEADWPAAVTQSLGTLLSGRPAVCLDWVNYTGGSEIVQLGHCGVGLMGHMAAGCQCEAVTLHPVLRQGGKRMGPVHIGQFEHGPKTGICMMQDTDGKFRMLAFAGESGPDTEKGMKYVAADVRFPKYRELNQLILEGGFPHHLATAFGDVREDLRLLCKFLDVEYVEP